MDKYQIIGGLDAEYLEALKERFWSKVDKRGPDECWEWQAVRQPQGYGKIGVGTEHQLAHRVSYELFVGPIPKDKPCVLHVCDNRPCVNYHHLFTGTNADNVADMIDKGRYVGPGVGANNPNSKLNRKAIIDIRTNYVPRKHGGKNTYYFAKKYGVTRQTVMAILNRETWTHVV